MNTKKLTTLMGAGAMALAVITPWQSAQATNGYFSHGYGASSKGMAGVGVALSLDSMAAATNPAAMVHVGDRFDAELGSFHPIREVAGDGTVNGTFPSDLEQFFIPQFGVNFMLDDRSSIGLTMSANGGMNTEYPSNPFIGFGPGASSGIGANNAPAGVDLAQGLIGVTYARKYGNHSIGITPTLAMQRFKAYGLQGYEGISSHPFDLHGRGYDYSAGYGMRFGYQGRLTGDLTVGIAGATKMYMQRFEKYKGLFADGGSFDIPANVTVGAAYKVPNTGLTVALDWQHIAYGDVDSISNSGAKNFNTDCLGEKALGAGQGCGFGWDNQSTIKLGLQYSPTDNLVLRAGASRNTQVYEDGESLFNILAPAVVRTHLSVGGTYSFSESHSVNFSYTHALDETQTGTHPNQGAGSTVDHTMKQHDFVVGYAYRW